MKSKSYSKAPDKNLMSYKIDISVFEQVDYTTKKVINRSGPETRGQIKLKPTTTARASKIQTRDAHEQLFNMKTAHYDRETDLATKMTLDAF